MLQAASFHRECTAEHRGWEPLFWRIASSYAATRQRSKYGSFQSSDGLIRLASGSSLQMAARAAPKHQTVLGPFGVKNDFRRCLLCATGSASGTQPLTIGQHAAHFVSPGLHFRRFPAHEIRRKLPTPPAEHRIQSAALLPDASPWAGEAPAESLMAEPKRSPSPRFLELRCARPQSPSRGHYARSRSRLDRQLVASAGRLVVRGNLFPQRDWGAVQGEFSRRQ